MAAPMIVSSTATRCFVDVLSHLRNAHNTKLLSHRCCTFIPTQQYSTKKFRKKPTRPKDSRFNIRYPYVPGDPLQETQIKEATSTKLRWKDGTRDILDLDVLQKQKTENAISRFTTHAGLPYTNLKDGDIRLGRTIMSIKSRLSVGSSKTILLEGQRLVRDALLLGGELKYLYFSDESLLQTLPTHLLKNVDLFKVKYRDLKSWLDTGTPSGIMGIFKKPEQGEVTCSRGAVLPMTLILDGVKDPGNAGTLVRTAAAVGCEKILAIKGCVNMWEGKVLRSGMGGHFAVPIYTSLDWPQVCGHVHEKSQVFLAEPKPQDFQTPIEDQESLQDQLDAHAENELNKGHTSDSDSSDDEDVSSKSKTKSQRTDDSLFHRVPLPSSLYCDVDLQIPDSAQSGTRHISLVVGGEARGLSATAKKFAYDHYGQYVSLPMAENIDSLNTAVAASVILYEFRRKLLSEGSS